MSYLKKHDIHVSENQFYSVTGVYVQSKYGAILVEICDQCGYEEVTCLHKETTKSRTGMASICSLCGSDRS